LKKLGEAAGKISLRSNQSIITPKMIENATEVCKILNKFLFV
jgi:hypothetical protein